MGKHSKSSDTTDSRPAGYKGQHRAGDRTAHLRREDPDGHGRVIGWAAGREGKPDNYTDR
jgi:hypothetical protein